jgi:hypothetical protein
MAGVDDYVRQMQDAAEREVARTAAEGKCTSRARDGDLCRRRVAKDLLAKGIAKCRGHVSAPRKTPAQVQPGA